MTRMISETERAESEEDGDTEAWDSGFWHQLQCMGQPWKKTATNTHGFGKTSLPRKVGGS